MDSKSTTPDKLDCSHSLKEYLSQSWSRSIQMNLQTAVIFPLFLTVASRHHYSEVDYTDECTSDKKIVEELLQLHIYNKQQLPYDHGVMIHVEYWIQGITDISELTNDFEMDIYITEQWEDPRLNFEHLNACKSNLSLSKSELDRMWTPNTCFVNSKTADIHDSPFENVFLTLFNNGTVWTNYRVRLKGPCSMDLVNFPMDIQECRLNYQSFTYNNEGVRLRWNGNRGQPVFTLHNINLPDFTLKDIKPQAFVRNYPAGMWDELTVTFIFERRYMWYILQAYIPTYLTILISWIAFSLGSEAIPSRTMLGVNALLSMIFHFGNIMRKLPRVSYIKAIDVWMLASMTFVFLSLIELAIVGLHEKKRICGRTTQKIDQVAKIMFPAVFSIFNIIYWARYGMKTFRKVEQTY